MTGTLIVVAILIGLFPASIARRKGYSFVAFWIFGALLFIVALPVALFMGDQRRKCPYCAEAIQPEAIVCPHCQRELTIAAA
jgi:hypothetical protein